MALVKYKYLAYMLLLCGYNSAAPSFKTINQYWEDNRQRSNLQLCPICMKIGQEMWKSFRPSETVIRSSSALVDWWMWKSNSNSSRSCWCSKKVKMMTFTISLCPMWEKFSWKKVQKEQFDGKKEDMIVTACWFVYETLWSTGDLPGWRFTLRWLGRTSARPAPLGAGDATVHWPNSSHTFKNALSIKNALLAEVSSTFSVIIQIYIQSYYPLSKMMWYMLTFPNIHVSVQQWKKPSQMHWM